MTQNAAVVNPQIGVCQRSELDFQHPAMPNIIPAKDNKNPARNIRISTGS